MSYANANKYRIEMFEGAMHYLDKIELNYYYGKRQYWYSTARNYYSNDSLQNHLCIMQGWLWSDIDIANVKQIERINRKELPKFNKKIRTRWPTIYKGTFDLNISDPIFKINFIDGSENYANISGTILGSVKVGSLSGSFSTKTKDISKIVFNGNGKKRRVLDFVFTSGEMQKNVTNVRSNCKSKWNRRDYKIYPYLRTVVESQDKRGGITVDLQAKKFAKRIISINKIPQTSHYEMSGVTDKPIKTKLAWIRTSAETHPSRLKIIMGKSKLNGVQSYIKAAPKLVKALTLKKRTSKSLSGSMLISYGKEDVEIEAISDFSFWYSDAASQYNTSDKKTAFEFRVGKIQIDMNFNDISGFKTNKNGKTTITLQNGESHTGHISMDSGKPYALVGKLSGKGYYGFAGEVCFLLNQIRTFDTKKSIAHIIREGQYKLHKLGYDPGPTDGSLGPKTKSAISAYQKDNKLMQTQEFDAPTMKKLGLK